MLDELPPYFVNAAAKSIGSDLAAVTTTALANLLVALGRDELRNVCLVISYLHGAYLYGEARIAAALTTSRRRPTAVRWMWNRSA